jgi:DNA-binding NarL/FixJ family response regulator
MHQMGTMVVEPERRTQKPLRVVIADDHAFYREGLARLLRENGIEVVGEAPDGEAAVRVTEETTPDVVLVDLSMPGLSGIEATRRLAEHAAPSRVVVLSVSAEDSDVTDAMWAGAVGYVMKDEPVEEVIAAIRAAASGAPRISPRTAVVLVRRVRAAIEGGETMAGGGLSGTELQVLDLLAAGRTDHEISELLSIDPGTVHEYVRSILTKLQVENRVRDARRREQS